VLYDVTSTYLEGRCCPLAQFGYSRDHHSDRPQLVIGLLCAFHPRQFPRIIFDQQLALHPTLVTGQSVDLSI
jgi:hypothetical protein